MRRVVLPAQRRRNSSAAKPLKAPGRLGTVALRVTGAVRRALNRLERTLGVESSDRALVAANPKLAAEERQIIDEVLTAGARHVSAVMVPRPHVVYLPADLDVADAVRMVRDTPHSRFPVIDGSHDDIVGFVHLRDLLMPPAGGPGTVRALVREVRRVPASKHVLAALSEMRSEGNHLAVVVDEYGGTAGIITLEDLIEELVGEIRDEYDAVPEPETLTGDVDGRLHLADFAQRCGFALPPGPYESLGGFVMARLGRLPVIGDEVRVDGWRLIVTRCEGRRVSRVTVRRS
ncbi:MAG TPA: hemolysin family protein [Micromonosporaceae bacterium]|jgi:putative hemolysin